MVMIQSKYVIKLSFLGLFLNIVANIMLYRYFMIEEIIVKQVATENYRIAEIYQKHIWDMHPAAIDKFKKNHYQNLLNDDDFIAFLKDSIAFFQHINAQVSLFDMHGNKFMSNMPSNNIAPIKHYYNDSGIYGLILAKIDEYFLRDLMTNQTIESAFRGKATNALWPEILVTNNSNQSSIISFISSYIPIIDDNLGDFIVDSVIEIDTDVTEQWKNMSYLGRKVFTAFLIIFSIFFSIVTYNTNYAQRIINKQFETNRGLEEARIRAETESSAKTEFLANVSHELRTPLNAIIGFSEIIISETYGAIENKQYKEYIQDINNSGKHLLSIINDILDFSKASVDKLKVEHVELDLNKLASSSMRFVKPRADEAKVELIENLPKEHVVIKADPKRLKQALLNLLSNSVKFTPEHGTITLKITKNEEIYEVYIQVIDTGIGMSEKDIPKALATFGQIDNKLSRKYEGTGLGLPLTKKLVELMHGKFDLTSIIGAGTTITLTFKYEDSIIV